MKSKRLLGLLPLLALLTACGGGGGGGGGGTTGGGPSGGTPPPPPVTYSAASGVAQKGPLIKGSAVTVQELDASLAPTGKQYSYQISSDLGSFEPTSTFTSQYVGLTATGYYFDEVQNAVSSGPVTLNGYSDLSADTTVNVNLLTTLAYQRIKTLIASGKTFAAARTQAEGEVLAALNIPASSYGKFGALTLSGTSDGDHILATISGLFVYGNQAGPLSVLINNFQSDIASDGTLTSPQIKSALTTAASSMDPAAVAANLNQRYQSLGVSLSTQNIADWTDRDGDGVLGKYKFQVTAASPSSSFTLPSAVVSLVNGTSVSVSAGQLSINGTPATGAVTVNTGDIVKVTPGAGPFPNGVVNAYLLRGGTKVARVSFINGLLSVTVTPASPSIAKGLSQQLTATGNFSDGSTSDLTSHVTWTSGTPGVATVSSTGLAQSATLGSAMMTATSGAISGSTTLTVTAAVAESIVISPATPRSGVGLNRQLTARATYSDGTTADVTTAATWTSNAPGVATVTDHVGLTAGVSLGSADISATLGSATGSVSLAIVGDSWSAGGELAAPRMSHTATLLGNGKVLVVGSSGGAADGMAELYDFVTDKWTLAASPLTPREFHTATLLPNGKVLVAGGMHNLSMPDAAVEIYDPAANTWTPASPMSVGRIYHTATLLHDGRVLVVGGTGGSGMLPATLNTAEVYDPAANTWSSVANLPSAVTGHTATVLTNGQVLVVGGSNTVSTPAVYNPIANNWIATGNMVVPRTIGTATALSGARALVIGGSPQGGVGPLYLASAEIYDFATNTWTPAGSLQLGRNFHTATLLPNGKVLVIGGGCDVPSNSSTVSVELYDPAAGISSPVASLATPRLKHTATLLPNNAIVVTGGFLSVTGNGFLLSSTELYW